MIYRKIIATTLTLCIIALLVCLIVFLPHLNYLVRQSGGILEIEFENGNRQYVANGGKVQVELGSKCILRAITSIDKKSHTLYAHNGNVIEPNETIIFNEVKIYHFDLYEKGGNYVCCYSVEVIE